MSAKASQTTRVSLVWSTVCSGEDQRKHQSSASLAFVRGIHWWPVDSPHKGPVRRHHASISFKMCNVTNKFNGITPMPISQYCNIYFYANTPYCSWNCLFFDELFVMYFRLHVLFMSYLWCTKLKHYLWYTSYVLKISVLLNGNTRPQWANHYQFTCWFCFYR